MENATNMTAVMVFIGNRDCGHFSCVAFSCMIRVDVERRAAMKSRLSANKYIRNNKRICFVLILALALSFAAMYVVAFLLNATTESIKPIAFELPKKMSFASINNPSYNVDRADFADVKEYAAALRKAKEQFLADLNADPDVEKVYDGNAYGITVNVTKPASGYSVKFSNDGGATYTLTESPKYTNAGDYTVYYQVTADLDI